MRYGAQTAIFWHQSACTSRAKAFAEESIRMAISKINRFIALFDTAFRALPAPVSMADTERLALLVHHAMESKKRVYHTSGHVFGMCEGIRIGSAKA